MNIEAARAEFPVLERYAYLNAGTFGPLPRAAIAAGIAEHEQEREHGRAGAGYYARLGELRTTVRAEVAAAIGATSVDVALTRSTGEGCAIVVNGLGLSAGDEVVTTDVEHYGLLGPLASNGLNVQVARVRERPAAEALHAIRDLIGPRTRLIALSHVAWSTGQVLPIAELVATGVPVLVDGAQSAGAIPVDVGELGCDFYTVSGQKWLLGPDATGGLFVGANHQERLAVTIPSYFGRSEHDERGTPVLAQGAARFDPGALPRPSLAALVESMRFQHSLGVERFTRARAQAERCRDLLAAGGVEVVTEPNEATLVAFRTTEPGADVVERLAAAGVLVREIPELGWVRVSVGFWTSDEDLERLVDAL